MKQFKRYRKWLWLLAIPFLAVTCMTIEDIIHPSDPKANSDIEIGVKIKLDAAAAEKSKLAFGILAPKSWNLGDNADVTVSTTGYKFIISGDDHNVTDEVMTVIPANENDPYVNKPWVEAYTDRYGLGDNYRDGLEWVIFESQTVFQISDKPDNGDGAKTVEAMIKIKFRTTDENIKLNMGYAFCAKQRGLEDKQNGLFKENFKSKELVVTGASGAVIDYTVKPLPTITEINHTFKPRVSTPLEIAGKVKIYGTVEAETKFAFGMLAPKIWNLGSAAEALLTTTGYTGGDVAAERMEDISKQTAPKSTKTWSELFMEKYGQKDNLGDGVEWVVFASQTTFDIDGKSDDVFGDIRIKFTPGAENVKFRTSYVLCEAAFGLHNDYTSPDVTKMMIVSGGSAPRIDYTWDTSVEYVKPEMFATVPSVFRYGDIFSVKFDAAGEEYEQLAEVPKVYLYGKAVYNNGQECIVDVRNDKTKMQNMGGTLWQKYLYPKTFFDLPEDAVIEKLYFHFTNSAGDIIVDDDGQDIFVTQSEE